MSRTIYCISGLGTDERIFSKLRPVGYKLKYIPQLLPDFQESIKSYAARLADYIREDNAVLLGVSFGGILGIEISKIKPLQKLIIISGIKSSNELPRWMKVAGKMKLNRVLPVRSYKFTEWIDNNRLGITTDEEKELARCLRQSADKAHMEWGVNEIFNWRNNWIPDNVVHIHGDKDRIFPVAKINADYIIKGATHLLVYNRADEVNKCICKILGIEQEVLLK
jgi:pimeloyl-ACP methyl ester carboxylesterase